MDEKTKERQTNRKLRIIVTICFCITLVLFLAISSFCQEVNLEENGQVYNYYLGTLMNQKWLVCNGPKGLKVANLKGAVQIIGTVNKLDDRYLLVLYDHKLQYLGWDSLQCELEVKLKTTEEGEIDCNICDLDLDGSDEVLMLSGYRFMILGLEEGVSKLYDKEYPNLKPWKVQTSDVDGDGKIEISMGVFKKSEFHPVEAKRPYIYDWDGTDLIPKWRGSRLAHPFEDYLFQDIDADGADELISLEYLEDGSQILQAYKWKGFGFEGVVSSTSQKSIEKMWCVSDDKIGMLTSDGNVSKEYCLSYEEGEWDEDVIL